MALVGKQKLNPEEKQLKDELLAEGFGHWGRRDFLAFIRGCAEHGWCARLGSSRFATATVTGLIARSVSSCRRRCRVAPNACR